MELLPILPGDKDLDRTFSVAGPGVAVRGKGEGASPACWRFFPESINLLLPSLLLSFPECRHVYCDNHVNLPQLFKAAVLSSPAVAGSRCFSIVFWLFDLTLFASTCWTYIRSLQLEFVTIDRTA